MKHGSIDISSSKKVTRRWEPVSGIETERMLRIAFGDKGNLIEKATDSASEILSLCADPETNKTVGNAVLVVGKVQSGKTLSFTSVAAMAKDNGYSMIVIIAGTSKYLLKQTEDRLDKDLNISTSRSWLHMSEPSGFNHEDVSSLRTEMSKWNDATRSADDKRTLIVTVMKQHTHLEKLAKLFSEVDFAKAPVLIIDDEADQASPDGNASSPKKDSPTKTYKCISDVRESLGDKTSHTFLQYTATPQANLLMSIADSISPERVVVIEPGEGYVGGRELFGENYQRYIRSIPQGELDVAAQDYPPSTLHRALASFVIEIADCRLRGLHMVDGSNRTMLVHPSRLTDDHDKVARWINEALSCWRDVIEYGDDVEIDDVMSKFEMARSDLVEWDASIPPLNELRDYILDSLKGIHVRVLNQSAPPVNWATIFDHVLVGGQSVERGFTVEGLTTTWMARGVGMGLADSIQQRARFFGYKGHYLNRIRIWVDDEVTDAYRSYVEHEEDLREQLRRVSESGGSLKDWQRRFLLDPSLKPTRDSIVSDQIFHGDLSDQWLKIEKICLDDMSSSVNSNLVHQLLSKSSFLETLNHEGWTDANRHKHYEAEISKIEEFVSNFVARDKNVKDRLQLASLQLSKGNGAVDSANIYVMGPQDKPRDRQIDPRTGSISNLHQGSNTVKNGMNYPGDRSIGSGDCVSLQLHHVSSVKSLGDKSFWTFALWIPSRLSVGYLIQERIHGF